MCCLLSYFENLSTSTVFVFSVHHFEMIFDVVGCEICNAFRLVPSACLKVTNCTFKYSSNIYLVPILFRCRYDPVQYQAGICFRKPIGCCTDTWSVIGGGCLSIYDGSCGISSCFTHIWSYYGNIFHN